MTFIKVMGKDHFYTNIDVPMYIALHTIYQVFPFYGEKDSENDSLYWRCLPNHENGKFLGYELFDTFGKKYTCCKLEEVKKLGIPLDAIPIGTEIELKEQLEQDGEEK